MLLSFLALAVALAALVWSADKFVAGAANLAIHFRVPPLVIGVTVVSLGTSAPEIVVAFNASLAGNPLLAVGNAIGSNIANIGLVLGATAIIAPLPFCAGVLGTEIRWMLGAIALALVLLVDLRLTTLDGALLLVGLAYVLYQLLQKHSNVAAGVESTLAVEVAELAGSSLRGAIGEFLLGLLILLVAADVLGWSATAIAVWMGVSELIIGLTIVAIGTSLPELAASIGAARKGHADIAIGNVVGSNILNILAVLSIPALIGQPQISLDVLLRDYGTMLGLTLALVVFARASGSKNIMTRAEGLVALSAWGAYTLFLVV